MKFGCETVDVCIFRINDQLFTTKLSPSVFEKELEVLEVLDHHVFVPLGRKVPALKG